MKHKKAIDNFYNFKSYRNLLSPLKVKITGRVECKNRIGFKLSSNERHKSVLTYKGIMVAKLIDFNNGEYLLGISKKCNDYLFDKIDILKIKEEGNSHAKFSYTASVTKKSIQHRMEILDTAERLHNEISLFIKENEYEYNKI